MASTDVPADRRFTDQHEWVLTRDGDDGATVVRVGITDHAQDALGDIVFVQLPEVGDEVSPGNPMGEVESTKSVSDVYAPVAGTVAAVNGALADNPEIINSDPYGEGWLVDIEPDDAQAVEGLLSSSQYAEQVRAAG